jgi:hypothetical protein
MPRETQFRKFRDDGPTYRCTPLHAMDASHLALELLQKLGPTIVAMWFDTEETFGELDKLRMVLSDGLHGVSRADHDRLLFAFLAGVQTEGMGPERHLGNLVEFNKHFDDVGLTTAYRLFLWSAEVNVRHYFADALSLVSILMAKAKEGADPKAGTSTSSETSGHPA